MKQENKILDLSIEFALEIIKFCEKLDKLNKFVISKQLLRSGTSIGANIHEAQSPESKNDFIHKLKIAHKEAVETKYWLILCDQSEKYPSTKELRKQHIYEVTHLNKLSMIPIIKINNGSVFQHDRLIINNINLEITEGEFVYLIGRSGSGKSSLLKTLYADLPAKDGSFKIAGYDLCNLKRKDIPMLRRKIGIVFQDFQLLYDRNVEQNLSFVLKATGWEDENSINKRIDEVLQLVGLQGKRKSMPHQLSGGEQQSVAIARALLNRPNVILADEPTGNLDPETTNDIMKLLMKIRDNGTTILMATHNYNLILKYPSRVISCANGTITESSK